MAASPSSAREQLYRANILEHYKRPHHWGLLGKADLSHTESNPACGDELGIQLKLDGSGKIIDVGLSGAGCAISIASASMLSDRLIGMTLKQAASIDRRAILDDLGIDPGPTRMRCALLGLEGLRKAVGEKTK
jgi:nitrogen fixation NifU-like protein